MLLDTTELLTLEEALRQRFDNDLTRILCDLNRAGELEEALEKWGLGNLLHSDDGFKVDKMGKILIVGDSQVKKELLIPVAKDLGIDKSRLEFVLSYAEAKKYNMSRIQYNRDYCLILFGPVPHSGVSKGDFSSEITAVMSTPGYPPMKKLVANEQLKITKNNFKQALEDALSAGIIRKG
ncbi:MAG: hypothetical protein IKB49_00880 [Alphaproteobacteria bacterium]|nr:hypothetical protein [Alphaproteobacteria bacterium]